MIETHCHFDYLKEAGPEKLLEEAKAVGINKIVTIGVDPDNLDLVMELSQKYSEIYFTQGIHPHDSRLMTELEVQKIKERSKMPKMVAVGEIGLDYHYNNSPPDVQRLMFEKQLQLAADLDLPVVIHTREAEDDTIRILKNFTHTLKRKGVVHSFTSNQTMAEFALSEGFCLGFNGIITFKKSESVQNIVKLTPLDRIFLETDAPFLTPVPHRGKENAPHYLPFVAQKVAELKNIDVAPLIKQADENALRVFFKLNEE